MKNLKDLFHHELKDMYSAESQLKALLPKMIEAATNKELKSAFEDHLKQTESHLNTVKEICQELGIKPGGEKCKGMEGLVKEAEHRMEDAEKGNARDAAMISAAQRIEHYEIAGYGSAKEYARSLGETSAREKIDKLLDEDAKCNEILNDIAIFNVNPKAN